MQLLLFLQFCAIKRIKVLSPTTCSSSSAPATLSSSRTTHSPISPLFTERPKMISFFTASDLEIEILNEDDNEYLNLNNPVEIPFTVNLDSKSGMHELEGKVKYFAYSKEEKWCLKSSSKFSVSFRTSSRTVKKKKQP